MKSLLEKAYDPHAVEQDVYKLWEEARAFHAKPDTDSDHLKYVIVIPPPNVTAALHMGHALNNTLQDILIRWHRMRGHNTLWMPGTDHAGIATQTIVDKRLQAAGEPALKEYKKLEAQGQNGREQFLEKVQAWKDEYEARITGQLKAMGCSCDWERQRFTMDPVCAAAVREAFFRLFRDGLIYRGKRLVNWDPVSQTALADDEVEMEEVDGFFYYMKYPVVDDAGQETGQFVTVATTRPETMLGDTAVAVNPKDPANAAFIGKKVRLPIVGRVIPVIGDDYVVIPDPQSADAKARFASGFLKVTPAHDPNDWEIGLRHKQAIGTYWCINVMAPDASISKDFGWRDWEQCDQKALTPLLGLSRENAREAVVKWFETHGLLDEKRPYRHAVGHSYRSHVPVEPYLSDQWYVRVTDERLAGAALHAMARDQRSPSEGCSWKKGPTFAHAPEEQNAGSVSPWTEIAARDDQHEWESGLRFHPARYAKTFQSWHENIRDWCISRQLWWGHRIPVWTGKWNIHTTAKHDESKPTLPIRLTFLSDEENAAIATQTRADTTIDGIIVAACVPFGHEAVEKKLEAAGFERDPDVLDTWFSSGLWPISTLGWPNPENFPAEIPEGTAALEAWNPGTTLCTAREIITLWVSRMVMFNLYFRKCLPFRDVFVHAMIQDSEGQKMSKSLGNGVDPLDIIHSHGADAMRFTLTGMTTQTQDVRMPVDLICPHTGQTFSPRMITNSSGHRVAAPLQDCPTDPKKKMVSSYGLASGLATPSDATPLARNTSAKFDQSRNFTNKIWNAARFALKNLEAADGTAAPRDPSATHRSPADQWILACLRRTIQQCESAMVQFRFNDYAQSLYDFFWRDLCDWYLEAVKPVIRGTDAPAASARAVLAACLDASLRLLHPAMPYLTEAVWSVLSDQVPDRSLPGLALPPHPILMQAAWPAAEENSADAKILSQFEQIQQATVAIRNMRNTHQMPPKQVVEVALSGNDSARSNLTASQSTLETLAGCRILEIADRLTPSPGSATTVAGEVEIQIHALSDPETEKQRQEKRRTDLAKSRAQLQGRLNNKGYIEKAPPSLVEETRKQLADVERELETLGG